MISSWLKKKPYFMRIGKTINIYKAFWKDAIDFTHYYIESAKRKKDYRYSIMLLVHSLEKGMCNTNPRPYGFDKVREMMDYLYEMEPYGKEIFEYSLGLSVLHAWIAFFENHGWEDEIVYKEVKKFTAKREIPQILSGSKEYNAKFEDNSEEYYRIISTRHSVRDFKEEKLRVSDINYAIDCFIETPTACNRQMCGLLYIENKEIKKLLDARVIGLPGFNKANTQYFVVTYDISAFAYSGERQQGLLNVGLCTANLIYGLHARGIGSCCLQWSNKPSEDREVRKAIGISDSERIGIVIGCGYYKEHNIIPCSTRKQRDNIYKVV